jgi:putative phosphonate metabolism protein
MRRYAVYLAPPRDHPLARFAAEWLGRDPWSGGAMAQPRLEGLSPERLRSITASPRRYGFHGTLKAPFPLAPGRTPVELQAAVADLAAARAPFELPLRLGALGGFLALVPAGDPAVVDRLAADCVRALDPFRAPLSAAELERRRAAGLSPGEEATLLRFGYPWVLDRFRFHMTLTGRLDEPERARVRALLEPLVAPLLQVPLPVDAVAVLEQAHPDASFRVTGHHRLGGPAPGSAPSGRHRRVMSED